MASGEGGGEGSNRLTTTPSRGMMDLTQHLNRVQGRVRVEGNVFV